MIRILFFKAYQPGLFDAPVTVSGHTTNRGKYVAPYHSTRKKRLESAPQGDLFAEPAPAAETSAKPRAPVKPVTPKPTGDLFSAVEGKPETKPAEALAKEKPAGKYKVYAHPSLPTGYFMVETHGGVDRQVYSVVWSAGAQEGQAAENAAKREHVNSLVGMHSLGSWRDTPNEAIHVWSMEQRHKREQEELQRQSDEHARWQKKIIDNIRAGNEPTAEEFKALSARDERTMREAAYLYQEIAGGTRADAERQIKAAKLRRGLNSNGEFLYDMRGTILAAMQSVKQYGVLGEKDRLDKVKAKPEPEPKPEPDPKVKLQLLYEQRKGLRGPYEDAVMIGSAKGKAQALAALDAANAEVEAAETAMDWPKPSTAVGLRKRYGIPENWEIKDTYTGGEGRPRTVAAGDYRVEFSYRGGQELGQVQYLSLKVGTGHYVNLGEPKPAKDAVAWVKKQRDEVEPEAEPEPKEGDTKTENGIEYRLQGGRWHRVTPEAEPEPKPEPPKVTPEADKLARLRQKIEDMGGQKTVAANILRSQKDPRLKAMADTAIRQLSEAIGISQDDVMAELGLKPKVAAMAKPTPTPKPAAKPEPASLLPPTGELSDDPSSPNYRYRDTGYVAGSRKELAAQEIRKAGQEGRRLRENDIDWEAVELNPRQAKELIVKSNLFGTVDWAGLKADGLDPGAGFLIDRVYASVGTNPSEDSPEARKLYALGLETLRDRLEKCRTTSEVLAVVKDIRDECDGVMLTAEQAVELEPLNERKWAAHRAAKEAEDEFKALRAAYINLNYKLGDAERRFKDWDRMLQEKGRLGRQQEKQWRRAHQDVESLRPNVDAAHDAMEQYRQEHPEAIERVVDLGKGWTRQSSPLMDKFYELREKYDKKVAEFREVNKAANPLLRTWQQLGDRFNGVLHWNGHKGSKAFSDHVYRAQRNQIDWSWAEKFEQGEASDVKGVTQREKQFRLHVAEIHERVGGRDISAHSTEALKAAFGLREVQSGNWVLDDPDSARFHVEQAAGGFADLADITGIPDNLLALNGRLALAFGARGRGRNLAHYEPVERVINLTKMSGGGSLGHEWFHAVDNILGEMATGHRVGIKNFLTENAETSLPPGELRDAFVGLREAIWRGDTKASHEVAYTAADVKTAKYNVDRDGSLINEPARIIRSAKNAAEAVAGLEDFYKNRKDRRSEKNRKDWIRMAVAYHGGNTDGGTMNVPMGAGMSNFGSWAIDIDKGKTGKYWSQTREMAARAFAAWCEDRLGEQGRKNTYLSIDANNQGYAGEKAKPYPEGEERERINAGFDRLFKAMREYGVMQKALAFLAFTRWDEAA